MGVVCGTGDAEIQVRNTGDAALQVTGIETGEEAWIVRHPPLPATLAPEETLEIGLTGGAAAGTLSIATTDPARPLIEVPLSAVQDAAPTLEITAPSMDSILDVSGTTRFEALVSDDVDASDALTLTWSSDVDGVLGGDPADAAGTALLSWSATDRSAGPHTVTLRAFDSCENEASTTVVLCQNEGYLAESLDLATWNFEGSARWDTTNGWVELTGPTTNQSGTAFQTATTVDSANVQIEFEFFVSGGSGADGFSVTALDAGRMMGFVGESGGGIGYAGLPGWSLEVDTWYNGGNDPTEADHLSLHIDGVPSGPVAWTALPEMEDGAWHSMSLSVVGTRMTVDIDGTTWIDQDVPELRSFPAYVGFTAATGAATNYHLINALQVEEFVCEE
jgi:hypothetical protein